MIPVVSKMSIDKGPVEKGNGIKQELFDLLNEEVYVSDVRSGKIIDVNKAACKNMGYTKEELIGLFVADIQAITKKQNYDWRERRKLFTSPETVIESIAKRKDGSTYPTEVTVKRVTLGSNNFFITVVRDITKRKKTQERLQTLTLAVHQCPNPMLITDARGVVEYINPAFTSATGYFCEELVGKPISHFSDLYPSEVVAVLKGGEEFKNELQLVRKNGEKYWALLTITPMKNNEGIVTHFLGISQEITHLKEVEEALSASEGKYRSLVDSAPDFIINIDRKGTIQFINRVLPPLKVEEVIGKNIFDFTFFCDMEIVAEKYKHVFKTGESVSLAIQEKISGRWYGVHAGAIKQDDEIVGITLIARDISDKKEVQAEKEKLQFQLKMYAQKLEKKVKKLEKQKLPLNKKERMVLSALTRFPSYNDQELSRITYLKRPTITSIRNRLLKNNWYEKITTPNLRLLGYDILCLFYHKNPEEFKRKEFGVALDIVKKNEQCFYSQMGNSSLLFLGACLDMKEMHQNLQRQLENPKLYHFFNQIKYTKFFFSSTMVKNFFNYYPVLRSFFGTKFDQEDILEQKIINGVDSFNKLSANEKELLYLYIKFPEASNEYAQKLTRLSKPTIIKIKKKLFEAGFLYYHTIPNMKKLGFNYSSLVYGKFESPVFDKKLLNQLASNATHSVFFLIDQEQYCCISLFRDKKEVENDCLKQKHFYQEVFQTFEGPHITIFKDTLFDKLAFSSLIKKIYVVKNHF